LNAELELCGRPTISMDRMVDTLAIAKRKHPGAKLSLDALCSRYGIDRSHRIKHGALLDAELLCQLYIELTGGRQIGLGLAAEETSQSANSVVVPVKPPADRTPIAPRKFPVPAEELERHKEFVATIENALWNR